MTILLIALASFIAGFCLFLMLIALLGALGTEVADHDAGAPEGDQSNFGPRSSPSPSAG